MIHCGAELATWEDLQKVETPAPTDSHIPIPHHDLVNRVRDELPRHHLEVVQEEHALSKDGLNYFGVMRIEDPEHPADQDGFSRVVGIRNSHNKRMAVGLVSGTSVFVCDNMAFSGEIQALRKHTSRVMDALPEMISTAVTGVKPLLNAERQRVKSYRAHQLEDNEYEVDHIMMDMLRRGVLTGSQLSKAWDHWANPPHEEFEDRNMWSLFNSVTEAYKGTGMRTLFQRSRHLHDMCDELTGFTPILTPSEKQALEAAVN